MGRASWLNEEAGGQGSGHCSGVCVGPLNSPSGFSRAYRKHRRQLSEKQAQASTCRGAGGSLVLLPGLRACLVSGVQAVEPHVRHLGDGLLDDSMCCA